MGRRRGEKGKGGRGKGEAGDEKREEVNGRGKGGQGESLTLTHHNHTNTTQELNRLIPDTVHSPCCRRTQHQTKQLLSTSEDMHICVCVSHVDSQEWLLSSAFLPTHRPSLPLPSPDTRVKHSTHSKHSALTLSVAPTFAPAFSSTVTHSAWPFNAAL